MVRGVPLETWVHPRDRAEGLAALEGPARRSLEFFTDYIGPFPFEKLGCIQAAGTDGGMEHASAIFFGENTIDHGPATRLVAHEIAHQWFGDSLTELDWDDIWLSEGFATYFALLLIEHEEGKDALTAGLLQARRRIFKAEARDPLLAVRHSNLADTRLILNDLVYQKGGWILHMLRCQIGDAAFSSGIRRYYQTHRDRNVTTDDFRRSMEEAAGTDLSAFFDQWLNRPGHPVLKGSCHYDPKAKAVILELAQTQPGDPYRLPLDVRLMGDGTAGLLSSRVEMNRRLQEFSIPVDREPSSLSLDPENRLLIEARIEQK